MVQPLSFDSTLLPAGVKWEGGIRDGVHWADRNGKNYLIISEKNAGMLAEPGFTANLYARCYNEANGTLGLYWEVKEFNANLSESVEYAKGTLEVMDRDQDGIAETCFIYEIIPDGADPQRVKLILHVKGQKYAIRGQFAGSEDDKGKVEEKHMDKSLEALGPPFSDRASKKWDAFEKAYYQSWNP